jgi:hypothetical protein
VAVVEPGGWVDCLIKIAIGWGCILLLFFIADPWISDGEEQCPICYRSVYRERRYGTCYHTAAERAQARDKGRHG